MQSPRYLLKPVFFDHIDDQVLTFNKLFLVLDAHASLRTFKTKHRKRHIVTAEIKALMLQRDSTQKLAHKTSHPSDWATFKTFRREVKMKIRQAETEAVRNDIVRNKANKASLWKTVRRCLNPYGNSCLSIFILSLILRGGRQRF